MFESLESRRYLNASLDENGLLTVFGTPGNDVVHMCEDGKLTQVIVNGQVTTFRTADIKAIMVDVGKGDDEVILGRRNAPAVLLGGAGDDTLSGGNGNDQIYGGPGNDYMFGRDGDDIMVGGPGSDQFIGGNGRDTADYSSRTEDLRIRVGWKWDDGALDEGDNVMDDIEVVLGGSGNDEILTCVDRPIEIWGGAGNDTLIGGPGNDTLYGNEGDDSLVGGRGNDYLADAPPGSNRHGGNDTLRGQGGDDTLVAISGSNTLMAGWGFDTIRARNGTIDTIDLGVGTYDLDADVHDVILPAKAA
jgi:Ca2+-binding RTX toxin-like protein